MHFARVQLVLLELDKEENKIKLHIFMMSVQMYYQQGILHVVHFIGDMGRYFIEKRKRHLS